MPKVPKEKPSRKQQFRAALALAGLTAKEWADREGIDETYLSRVLNEQRTNEAIIAKVDAFTKRHFPLALAS